MWALLTFYSLGFTFVVFLIPNILSLNSHSHVDVSLMHSISRDNKRQNKLVV